jgi:hypothetical protein
LYNDWFLEFAPRTYREERTRGAADVEAMLRRTNYLRSIAERELRDHPSILFALRMSTAPPIARDRLVGLAGVSKSLVNTMEKYSRLPPKTKSEVLDESLARIVRVLLRLLGPNDK